jgi:hypothetical protein
VRSRVFEYIGTSILNQKEKYSEEVCRWSSRRMSPKIMLYVAIVFIFFIAVSYFGFHSVTAVKGLVFTALGSIVSLMPLVFTRVEYRFTQERLESRPIRKKEQHPYKTLFLLDQLSHIVKIDGGFKFYLVLKERNSILRFFKKYISNHYSGEVRLENKDTERVMTTLEKYGISIRGKWLKVNT